MPGGKHGNRTVYDDDLDWDEDDFDDFDEDEEADEDSHWYGHSAQAPNKEADKPTADGGTSDDLLGQLIPGFNGLTPNSAVVSPPFTPAKIDNERMRSVGHCLES